MDLTIPYSVSGVSSGTVEGWVATALSALSIANDSFSHTMFVLPEAVDFGGAAAYAYVNSHRSVYDGAQAKNILVLMHELGHNLKMRHSGKNAASCECVLRCALVSEISS